MLILEFFYKIEKLEIKNDEVVLSIIGKLLKLFVKFLEKCKEKKWQKQKHLS